MKRSVPASDADHSFEKVPESSRKGFWPMFFVMLGFTFFSASMSVGAKLGNGLDLKGFVAAVLAGGVILASYTGVLAYIGCKTGLSFDLLARKTFGTVGSYLPSLMIALTQVGWFGVGVAMFAIPASDVIGCSKWVLIAVAGICMTSSAYFGIKGMEIVSYVSVPLIVVLGVYSMVTASAQGGGVAAIFARNYGTLTVYEGVGLVVGSFISGGTTTPNFTRFARGKTASVVATVIAFFIGNSLMFAFGAVGGAFTGHEDIFYIMIAQGLTVQALIVLGANIWTTNDNSLYSGALSLANITGVPKRPLVIAEGIAGTLASIWLYDNFVSWLNILNATLPPVGAVVILDYAVRLRKEQGEEKEPVFIIPSVAGVAAGALVGIISRSGMSSLLSMGAACLCYYVLGIFFTNRGRE